MSTPVVSIVMLACNKSIYTERTLRGLLVSTWPAVEVILLDNGSTDNTRAVFGAFKAEAEARGWRVNLLREDENVGAVKGRNLALAEVSGDYVVFLDNDVVVGVKSWLERMTARLDSDPTIGVLGPKILFAAPPHVIQCAGCMVGDRGRVGFRGRGEPRDAPAFDSVSDVPCLISACWIMPRKVMNEVGELDMQFHPVQFEDIDYCYRIRDKGLRCVYDPEVFVYHYENVTTDGTESLNYRYLTVKNGLKFKRKWAEVIAKETGPDDASMEWCEIPHVPFDSIGELLIHD